MDGRLKRQQPGMFDSGPINKSSDKSDNFIDAMIIDLFYRCTAL